jgi:transcriptional regulator with XRE-family HTH domain
MNATELAPAAIGGASGIHLSTFLRKRRGCISPASLGLPIRKSRRSQGLGREDVAELLEVTPVWYSLFESGKPGRRFSASFVHRLAQVLRLNAAEHDTLCRLVVEGGLAAGDLEAEWRWTKFFSVVAQTSRNLAGALSSSHALDLAVHALRTLLADCHPTVTLTKDRPASPHVTVLDADGTKARRVMLIPIPHGTESMTIRIESSDAGVFTSAEIAAAEMIALHLAHPVRSA